MRTFRAFRLKKLLGVSVPLPAPAALAPIGGLTLSRPRPGVKGRKNNFYDLNFQRKKLFLLSRGAGILNIWEADARATLTLDTSPCA